MADQIVLAWTVDVSGSSLGPAGAATALAAVTLYQDDVTDPVLGQMFGLTVDTDATVAGVTDATRTLTLNLNAVNAPEAPPPFPCRPNTSTPPVLPYELREARSIEGSLSVATGSVTVVTGQSMLSQLAVGDQLQFLSQQGVPYEIAAITDSDITLTAPYTGRSATTTAFQWVPAPVVLAAVYSSSDDDTEGVATTPAIPAGPGAQEVEIDYLDSTGAGPFTVAVDLTGRRPAPVVLDGGSIDIAVITGFRVDATGGFQNSIGQITLVELSEELPVFPVPTGSTPSEFRTATDVAQLLIERHLVYMPPSYSALAQQGAARPQLAGDFLVTTGSPRVETTEDQSGVLSQGDVIQFASQLTDRQSMPTTPALADGKVWVNRSVFYTVAEVGAGSIVLETPYSGIDDNFTGQTNPSSNAGTKGNLGTQVTRKLTAAFQITPSPATPPTDDQLAATLGQFVQTATVVPPATIPTPTFLSDLFTRTIQLALAVPVVAEPITFLP